MTTMVHKQSRLRQSIKWYTFLPALGGVGMSLVGIVLPYTNLNMPENLARAILFIGVGFIGLSLVAGVWRFVKTPVIKELGLDAIIPTLEKMDSLLRSRQRRKR